MKNTANKKSDKINSLIKKFNKKPLSFRITVITASVLIFAAAFFGACKLFGSPIAKIRAIGAAKDYISENMPGMDADRSLCKYDLKRNIYYIEFTPAGRKTPFVLEFDEDGRLTKDGYTLDYMYSDIYDR